MSVTIPSDHRIGSHICGCRACVGPKDPAPAICPKCGLDTVVSRSEPGFCAQCSLGGRGLVRFVLYGEGR
jgi:hypothetical protein